MARITHVAKAQASKKPRWCARCGVEIKPGEPYKWFANRIGRMSIRKNYCRDHSPRPSDMTTSDKLSALYAAQEAFEDAQGAGMDTPEHVADRLHEAADSVREVAEAYTESADNIEEGFGHETMQSQEIREKAEAVEAWADEIDDAANDCESMSHEDIAQDEGETDEAFDERAAQEILDHAIDCGQNVMMEFPL